MFGINTHAIATYADRNHGAYYCPKFSKDTAAHRAVQGLRAAGIIDRDGDFNCHKVAVKVAHYLGLCGAGDIGTTSSGMRFVSFADNSELVIDSTGVGT